jgi:hypothetical protein
MNGRKCSKRQRDVEIEGQAERGIELEGKDGRDSSAGSWVGGGS